MLELDGREGEGGGQILRTALTLSLVTGTPFRIRAIRGGRSRPGLLRQHLTACRLAAQVGRAAVEGDELGSGELTFEPRGVEPGEYEASVPSAGSALLVLQTVLPALAGVQGRSRLTLGGGTHNPSAPPWEFLERTYLPLLRRLGPRVEARLERPGFFPAGGGRVEVRVHGEPRLDPFELAEAGPIVGFRAEALVANLPAHIARREIGELVRALSSREELRPWLAGGIGAEGPLRTVSVEADGPGNVLLATLERAASTEVVTGFGRRGVPAERVARETARGVRRLLAAAVPVGPHLADQLVLLLALAAGGSFETVEPTPHLHTNVGVIRRFLEVDVEVEERAEGRWRVGVRG